MRAMGTHNANFNKSEKSNHEDYPRYQQVAVHRVYSSTAKQKWRECNEDEMYPILYTEMTMKITIDGAIITRI
jgi:hypothetical protein